MKKRGFLSGSACVLLVLSLIITSVLALSCTKTSPAPSTPTQPGSGSVPTSVLSSPQGMPNSGKTPQYGGTLKLIVDKPIVNLGAPWKPTGGSEKPWNRPAVEALCGLNDKGEVAPQLATSWEENPAAKTITFTLRQGVKFHDGTDFNAEAAKWNLDMVRNGVLPHLKLVSAVDVLDNYKIRMTLSEWDPTLLKSMVYTGGGKMVSPTANKKLIDAGKEDECLAKPVGTGPFVLESFTPNVGLKYKKFDGYWQKGLPYLDAIEASFIKDMVVGMTAFEKGESDSIYYVEPSEVVRMEKKGYTPIKYLAVIWSLAGDSANADSPFHDIRVRQALAYAIDTEALSKDIFDGQLNATNQLAAKGMSAYDPSIVGYPYNPSKAKQLLADAGYGPSKPLSIKLQYTTHALRGDYYTAVQGYFKDVGVNLELENLDNATTNKLANSGWQNSLQEHRTQYNGIEVVYTTGVVTNLSAKGERYVSIEHPADYQALIDKAIVENDPAKREELFKQINKTAVDKYCLVIPCWEHYVQGLYSPKVHDMGQYTTVLSEFLPEIAWKEK